MASEDFIPLDGSDGQAHASSSSNTKPKTNTTVFVSSLPYTATTTDLITHFSFLGPVRHGFVATDRESGKSKGVGYVTYSLKEDAEQAVAELNGSAFGDKGRKIRVSWADEKPSMLERKTQSAETREKRPRREPKAAAEGSSAGPGRGESDPEAIKTLVLTGLPADLTKAVLWKRIRKVDEKAELRYPVEGEENTAHVVLPTHAIALKSLPKLHGHTYKGALLSCVLKKRLDRLTTGTAEGSKAPSHAGRLIIRNLAWDTTEQDLRAAFLPFGPIHSINVPTAPSKFTSSDPNKPAAPRARGFAFVWFLTKKDAEAAMEKMNGKPIPKAVPAGAAKGKTGRLNKVVDTEARPVAVDWALSKDQWEKTKAPETKTDGDVESSSNSESGSESSGSSSGSDSNDEENEDEDSDAEMEDVSGDLTIGDAADAEDEEEAPVKRTLPSVDVGSTLFIRNLPFEVTEQELNTLFRSFGPLRYARITIDKATGRSRGTGFVCFWNTEHADAAIEEAQKVASETGANAMPLGGSTNPFALPSVLTADPSSSLASRLVIHGRTLEVTRAVTREDAGRMKEDSERARIAGDKRNTYLMREGVVFPNSPAAAALPEAEVEKRQSSFNARRTLLRSNPSLYISKTRLSIRQLPLFVTDRGLKRLAIHAVREFDAELESGTREGLSRAEETDETLSPALAARKEKRKKGERETSVIQSKVVRQSEKLDPLTAQGRSKGYGFLEMRSHKEALKVLRWANNNKAVGELFGEWWKVELAEILERTKTSLDKAREAEKEGKAKKEEVEEVEGRVRRLESRVAEKGTENGMRGGKTLMIEFSIENVQVVKRRVEKVTADREGVRVEKGKKRKAIEAEDSDDEGAGGAAGAKKPRGGAGRGDRGDRKGGKRDRDSADRGAGGKKPRREKDGEAAASPAKPAGEREKKGLEKLGGQLGSMIGRKRKMRKGGK